MEPIIIGESLKICQINVEGASVASSEYLSRLAYEHKVDAITVQETHINDGSEYNTRGLVSGFKVIAYVLSPIYGAATYIRADIDEYEVIHVSNENNISMIVVKIDDIKITNVYKPPNSTWPEEPIPNTFVQHPAVCIGDFNSHHLTWGYNVNDANGDRIHEWSEAQNMFLVYLLRHNIGHPSSRRDGGQIQTRIYASCRKMKGTFRSLRVEMCSPLFLVVNIVRSLLRLERKSTSTTQGKNLGGTFKRQIGTSFRSWWMRPLDSYHVK